MMKLYYSAGSCSTSCHIILEEAGLNYEAIEVDWDNASDPNLALISKLNPLETLPVFITEDGKQLDQNIAIQLYAAGKAPEKDLMPKVGTYEYAEVINALSFVAADLHRAIGGLFSVQSYSKDTAVQSEVRNYLLGRAHAHLKYFNEKLESRAFIAGKKFSPADAYAFIVVGWTKWLEIPLTPYKNIEAYLARIAARPAVAKVLKDEGLI